MMIRLFESKSHAEIYAKYRPKPTAEIVQKVIDFLNKQSPLQAAESRHQCMVDVGCGNGQSTGVFAPYFSEVFGIDVSPNQIEHASRQYSNVKYLVASGESLPFKDSSVDLLTCCEAVHWLDINAFLGECARVLKPNGCLALIGYIQGKITPCDSAEVDSHAVQQLFSTFINACKLHQRSDSMENHYRDVCELVKSKNKIYHDDMQQICDWNLKELKNSLSTWSGYQAVQKESVDVLVDKYGSENVSDDMIKKHDILEMFISQLKKVFGAADKADDQVEIKFGRDWFMILSDKPSFSDQI